MDKQKTHNDQLREDELDAEGKLTYSASLIRQHNDGLHDQTKPKEGNDDRRIHLGG